MTVIIFIAVLLVLIVGHEFGHFATAKLLKMRVLEFGVGFPPKIFGKRFGGGETEYSINWLPLGGFVRLFGEDPKEAGNEPGAFVGKPAWQQALVLFAGPFANLVLAFALSSLAFTIGAPAILEAGDASAHVENAYVIVGEVLPASPAFESGIVPGDRVEAIEVEGIRRSITTPEEIAEVVEGASGGVTVSIRSRDGVARDVVVTPAAGLIEADPERQAIGVATALVGVVSYPLPVAVFKGLEATGDSVVFVAVSLGSLIASAAAFSADLSNVAGPVGIASLTGEAARFGFGALLSFAALLSVNLALINFLPFPALDGGRLLFLGLEALTRRKIPHGVASALNTAGFALLIALMVGVTVGDVSRLLG